MDHGIYISRILPSMSLYLYPVYHHYFSRSIWMNLAPPITKDTESVKPYTDSRHPYQTLATPFRHLRVSPSLNSLIQKHISIEYYHLLSIHLQVSQVLSQGT